MSATIYFIGAGPGSADLMTIRGAKALARSMTVFAVPPFQETYAEELAGKTVHIPFDYYFAEMTELIEAALVESDVAFLIPGDLTFYSPFQPILDHFGKQSEVIPGVGVANAFSAELGKTFDLPGVCSRTVIASPRTLGDEGLQLKDLVEPGVSLLLYMNNIPLPLLVAELREGYAADVPIAIGHRVALPGEEVYSGKLSTIEGVVGGRDIFNLETGDKRPALTLVVVGETLTAVGDAEWWDFRRRTIWQHREF